MMLNDALYGILFRDINMQRTLVDQYFSKNNQWIRRNYYKYWRRQFRITDDAVEAAHTVLASQFINEQFAN